MIRYIKKERGDNLKKGIIVILTAAMLLSGCGRTPLENKKETPVATEKEDEKNMTENDLSENEFLVHGVILSYTGFEKYEIKKNSDDESVLVVNERSKKTTITVKAYDNEKNIKLTKRVLKAKNDTTDDNGYVYYSLAENDMKYIVYLQSATMEIKCDGNKEILNQITCRKSNLSCC